MACQQQDDFNRIGRSMKEDIVPQDAVGLKGWLKRCAAATNTREVWVAIGVVFLVLGLMGSRVYLGIGAAFLAIGLARKNRRRSTQ